MTEGVGLSPLVVRRMLVMGSEEMDKNIAATAICAAGTIETTNTHERIS